MAEIDLAKSMQDLEGVGSVFGSTRMSFETVDSQIVKGLTDVLEDQYSSKG